MRNQIPRSSASRNPQQSTNLGGEPSRRAPGNLAAADRNERTPDRSRSRPVRATATGIGVKDRDGIVDRARWRSSPDRSIDHAPIDVHGAVAAVRARRVGRRPPRWCGPSSRRSGTSARTSPVVGSRRTTSTVSTLVAEQQHPQVAVDEGEVGAPTRPRVDTSRTTWFVDGSIRITAASRLLQGRRCRGLRGRRPPRGSALVDHHRPPPTSHVGIASTGMSACTSWVSGSIRTIRPANVPSKFEAATQTLPSPYDDRAHVRRPPRT